MKPSRFKCLEWLLTCVFSTLDCNPRTYTSRYSNVLERTCCKKEGACWLSSAGKERPDFFYLDQWLWPYTLLSVSSCGTVRELWSLLSSFSLLGTMDHN